MSSVIPGAEVVGNCISCSSSGYDIKSHEVVDNVVGVLVGAGGSEHVVGDVEHSGGRSSAKVMFEGVASKSGNELEVVTAGVKDRGEFKEQIG